MMKKSAKPTPPAAPQSEGARFILVPVAQLVPTSDQPRSEFNPEKLEEMAHSIRDLASRGGGIDGTGILQPLLVRYDPDVLGTRASTRTSAGRSDDPVFFITAGETRWHAAQMAGVPRVPVIVQNQTKDEAHESALLENIHRNDLSPLDEGRAFAYLMNKHRLSFRGLAKFLYGDVKRVNYVQSRLEVLGAGADLHRLITRRPDSVSIVRENDRIKEPKARALLIEAAEQGAKLKEITDRVKAHRSGVSLNRYRGGKEVEGYEKKHAKEARAASSTGKTTLPRVPRHDLGALFDSLIRQLEDAQAKITDEPISSALKTSLRVKARRLTALCEVIEDDLKPKRRAAKRDAGEA